MVQVRRARHNHVRRVFGFAVWSLLVQVIVATSSSNDSSTCDENSTLSTRDNGNWFKPPKLVIKQEMILPTALAVTDPAATLALLKSNTSYNTDEKARGFLLDGIAMLGNKYGIHFPDGYQDWPVSQLLSVPVEPDSFVVFGSTGDLEYTSTAVCVGTTCSKPPAGAIILDFFYVLFAGPSGITLNGTFGGNAGKFAPQGTFIVSCGLYVHRGLGTIDGLNPNDEDVEMTYYADCPIATINYPNPDGGSAAVSYVNSIVDNDILGRGRASGTVITYSDGENTSFAVQNALFFDDEWPVAPTGSGRITPLVPQPTFQREFQTDIVVFADGVLPVSRSRSRADILPYLFAHHYTHEAGIKFLRRWTAFKLDSEIRALRHSFLVALRDTFGIGLVRPDDWNDLPLHAQIDLGRGNTVVPYVVNHLSNQRALLKVLPDDGVEQLGLDSRMHEGGFRLLVGSSGLDTSAQHLPFGSLILQGVYVIENGSNGNTEIAFRSKFPMITDPWSTLSTVQELHNPALGDGEARILVAESSPTAMGQKINIRGNFGFRGP